MNSKKYLHVLLGLLLLAFINIMLKTFIVDFYKVNGHSMSPTLKDGEYVCVFKSSYGIRLPDNIYEIPWIGIFLNYVLPDEIVNNTLLRPRKSRIIGNYNKIERGDVIAVNNPLYVNTFAIKRCIAVPGDSLGPYTKKCTSPLITPFAVVPKKGDSLTVKNMNEREVLNMHRNSSFYFSVSDSTFIALEDFYYVEGDNYNNSHDSRIWGLIPQSCIIGEYLFKF